MIVSKKQLCTTSKDLTVKPTTIQGSRQLNGHRALAKGNLTSMRFSVQTPIRWPHFPLLHQLIHHPGAWKRNTLQSSVTINSELWSQMELFSIYIQLTLEQHGLELHMFTYRRMFFFSGKYSTTRSMVAWLCDCGTAEVDYCAWASTELGVCGRSWNKSLEDTKGRLYFSR